MICISIGKYKGYKWVKVLVYIHNSMNHEDKLIDVLLEFRICQLVNKTNAIKQFYGLLLMTKTGFVIYAQSTHKRLD